MDTSYAEAIQRLEEQVDRACSEAQETLSNKEIAEELRRLAQGWEDSE